MAQKFPHAFPVRMVVTLTLLLSSGNALAYLDPSTGSMVVSAIVGILASVVLAVKTYWYRIRRFLRRASRSPSVTDSSSNDKE